MSNAVKITLYALGIGALYWLIVNGKQKLSEWGNKITFKIVSFGRPEVRSGNFSVPLVVRITNQSPVAIPLSNLVIKISQLKNGMYHTVGMTDPTGPFTIKQGDNDLTLYPRVDIAQLNPLSNAGNILNSVLNVLTNQNPLLDLKVDADITVQGLTFTETTTQKIYLNKLLNAA